MTRRAPAVRTQLLMVGPEQVEVRRSARRRRSVQAYREAGRIVVLVPAAFSAAEEHRWVEEMVRRITRSESRRRRPPAGDEALQRRAGELSRRYLDGRAQPSSVRWVTNQGGRWGSCTPSTGTIRLSHRLQAMPPWVVDYVLVHELAHLLAAGHGPDFWALVSAYPRAERAQGYLEGVQATAGLVDAWPTDADDGAPDGSNSSAPDNPPDA